MDFWSIFGGCLLREREGPLHPSRACQAGREGGGPVGPYPRFHTLQGLLHSTAPLLSLPPKFPSKYLLKNATPIFFHASSFHFHLPKCLYLFSFTPHLSISTSFHLPKILSCHLPRSSQAPGAAPASPTVPLGHDKVIRQQEILMLASRSPGLYDSSPRDVNLPARLCRSAMTHWSRFLRA